MLCDNCKKEFPPYKEAMSDVTLCAECLHETYLRLLDKVQRAVDYVGSVRLTIESLSDIDDEYSLDDVIDYFDSIYEGGADLIEELEDIP